MPQFDVYELKGDGGLVVDIQSDLLDPLNTRVVIPLLVVGATLKPAKRLNPVFSIANESRILGTQFLASIPASELRNSIGSLLEVRDEITAALDMLYQGI